MFVITKENQRSILCGGDKKNYYADGPEWEDDTVLISG
jgi:hypothetical protein